MVVLRWRVRTSEAVWGYLGGSCRAGDEDIWVGGCWDGCGCLGGSLKARGEDAIKGLRPHICSPLGCWNVGGHGSTVSTNLLSSI